MICNGVCAMRALKSRSRGERPETTGERYALRTGQDATRAPNWLSPSSRSQPAYTQNSIRLNNQNRCENRRLENLLTATAEPGIHFVGSRPKGLGGVSFAGQTIKRIEKDSQKMWVRDSLIREKR
jgi:hypothetical protein